MSSVCLTTHLAKVIRTSVLYKLMSKTFLVELITGKQCIQSNGRFYFVFAEMVVHPICFTMDHCSHEFLPRSCFFVSTFACRAACNPTVSVWHLKHNYNCSSVTEGSAEKTRKHISSAHARRK